MLTRDPIAVGEVVGGKYRVERVLGSGAMGVVVAARHVQLNSLVALKFMTAEGFAQPDRLRRFLREAQAAAPLRSEHITRVTDVGSLDSGAPYMVMEYLEGRDLAAVLAREGPLPIDAAVEHIAQVCEALDEAHRAGIVHRDIKPSNLFLTKRINGSACVKVLDFGISKWERPDGWSSALSATASHMILGSPLYMAPEQIRASRDVDARTDIWALGATLYELVTGRVPFQAKSIFELGLQIVESEPPKPRTIRAEIAAELETIILRCLEKDPERRYSSAQLLGSALEPFARKPTNASPAKAIAVGSVRTEPPETSAPALDDAMTVTTATRGPVMPAPAATRPARAGRTGAALTWGRSGALSAPRSRFAWALGATGVLALGPTAYWAHRLLARSGDPQVTPSAAPENPAPSALGASADASSWGPSIPISTPSAIEPVALAPPAAPKPPLVAPTPPSLPPAQHPPAQHPPPAAAGARSVQTPAQAAPTRKPLALGSPEAPSAEPSIRTAPPPPPAASRAETSPQTAPAPAAKDRDPLDNWR
ncbi:MAG: protein kinase [Polyangiaceae bacterium]|nr:protein kinase [Polyangiaceae bacterium]